MQHETLAPWAEPVADAPIGLTADALLALPDDGYTYELVEGRLVRMPGSGLEASSIAAYLVSLLTFFVRPRALGVITDGTGEYNLTRPGEERETALIPDVACVRAGRLPPRDSPAYARAPRLAPDLVAEIASPNQYHTEMDAWACKARLYLDRGVKLVWVIWLASQQIDVWRPGFDAPVATLAAPQMLDGLEMLDGLDVLPGFAHPVGDVFA